MEKAREEMLQGVLNCSMLIRSLNWVRKVCRELGSMGTIGNLEKTSSVHWYVCNQIQVVLWNILQACVLSVMAPNWSNGAERALHREPGDLDLRYSAATNQLCLPGQTAHLISWGLTAASSIKWLLLPCTQGPSSSKVLSVLLFSANLFCSEI